VPSSVVVANLARNNEAEQDSSDLIRNSETNEIIQGFLVVLRFRRKQNQRRCLVAVAFVIDSALERVEKPSIAIVQIDESLVASPAAGPISPVT
jgi:hypothetical protein